MSIAKMWINKVIKISRFLLVFILIFAWIFSGWPQVWQNPPVPPQPKKAKAAVPAGVIVAWPNASSTIPAGWYRDPTLDGYFLKMVPTAATNPGTTGGTASHTHTFSAHTHTENGHTHDATSTPVSSTDVTTMVDTGTLSAGGHTHALVASGSQTPTNQNNAVTTSGTGSSLPPYKEVLWIYSTGTTNIPNGAIVFFDSSSLPTNWLATTTGYFLRGADAGTDPVITAKGADTHTHTSLHTHIENTHTHTSSDTGQVAEATRRTYLSNGTTLGMLATHTHTATYGNATPINNDADGNIQAASSWPPYYSLVAIQNNTGATALPESAIALWRGAIASIPTNWTITDGNNGTPNLLDRFVNATSTANLDKTGGAAGHDHTAIAHTHTQQAHSHSITYAGTQSGTKYKATGALSGAKTTHTHTGGYSSSTIATLQDATITINSNTDTRPPYYEVAYIQYKPASLTLIVSTDNFPSLTPGTPVFATSTVSVNTNKSTGWYVTLERQDADTTLDLDSDATVNITDQTAWSAPVATTTSGNSYKISSLINSSKVLAFRVMTASSTNGSMFFSPSWWGSGDSYIDNANTLWAGIPAPSSGQKIGISSVNSGGSPALNTVLYYLDVPNTQKTGAYSGNVIFTAVMNE